MKKETVLDIRAGFETAYIDSNIISSEAFKPSFVSNNYKQGKKVVHQLRMSCYLVIDFKLASHL